MSRRAQRGGLLAKLIVALLILALLFAGYVFLMLKWSYSSGERAGWVQKLSHKGWLCKTWEGELSMVAMPGAMPEKFLFTVWDDRVAEELNKNMGRRVSLSYEEKIGIPTDCFGETRYFVTRVNVIEGGAQQPGGTPLQGGQQTPAPAAPAPSSAAPPATSAPVTVAPADPAPAAALAPSSASSSDGSVGSGLRLGPAGGAGAPGSGLSLKPGS
ncbi:MAG: hypothetical protein ABIU95_14655 [Burkholderiales bacterium]